MGAHASLLLLPGKALGLPFPASLGPAFFVCCSGGLHNVIYAFGLGYGLCMATGGLVTYAEAPPTTASKVACGLYTAYGLRLAWFLLRRQMCEKYNNSSFGKKQEAKLSSNKLSRNLFITSLVTVYQMTTAVALQPIAFAQEVTNLTWGGLALGYAGVVLEAIADEEKLAAKRRDPEAPVMTGTYSLVQHPNYLGEVTFWAGVTLAAQSALPLKASVLERVGAGLGPVLMTRTMFSVSKNLSKRQGGEKYANNAEYQSYASRTPILIPGIY